MELAALAGLILFLQLFGTPMWNVFIKDVEYKYTPWKYEGDYLVTGEEWDIAEEIEERQKALESSWLNQASATRKTWEEDLIEEGFDETEAESEEHY